MRSQNEKVYHFTSLYATEQINILSTRARNALWRYFPSMTVGGFVGLTCDDFMKCRNIGRQSLLEIMELQKTLSSVMSDSPTWDKPTLLVYDFVDDVDWVMECAQVLYADFYVEEIPPLGQEDYDREQLRLKLADRVLVGLTGDYEHSINEVVTMMRVAGDVREKLIVYYPNVDIRRVDRNIADQLDYAVSLVEKKGVHVLHTMEELICYINSDEIYIQQQGE